MKSITITAANIVNEGKITRSDILAKEGLIYSREPDSSNFTAEINAEAN